MSNVIDEKVVSMRFDNSNFEKNCKDSMNTLKNLRNSIDTAGSAKGLSNLAESANKLNFGALNSAIETVNERFSNLGIIGTTALMNITNRAVDAGIQLVKSLSVDQISAGWDKFADKSTTVGTLIAQGFDMSLVEEQMAKLNWFTDETSYNFVDMAQNIGKFTATGLGLEESVNAMMGIANWAALSGQNAVTASRAMYQLSQAMGKGALKYDDFKSIQNASMDTKEFREKALEAAEGVTVWKDTVSGLYGFISDSGKKTKAEMTINDMFTSEALTKQGWINKEVMMNAFSNYAGAIDGLYDAVTSGQYDTASEAIEGMKDELDAFQLKAFQAGQECRTFKDAIDSIKDAASTRWMNIFENIFGNYEESKKLWTDFNAYLYDVFMPMLDNFNEGLSLWHDNELFGRDKFISAVYDIAGAITNVSSIVSDAFHSIFPEKDKMELALKLSSMTKSFSEFAAKLREDTESIEPLSKSMKALFSILDLGVRSIKGVFNGAKKIISAIGNINLGTGTLISKISDAIISFHDWVVENEFIERSIDVVSGVLSILVEIIADLINNAVKFIKEFKDFKIVKDVSNWISGKFNSALDKLASLLGLSCDHTNTFVEMIKELGVKLGLITDDTNSFTEALEQIQNKIDFTKPFDKLREMLDGADPKTFDESRKGVLYWFKTVKNAVIDFNATKDPDKLVNNLSTAFGAFGDTCGNVWKNTKDFFANFDSSRFKNLAVAGSAILSFVSIHSAVDSFIQTLKSFSAIPNAIVKTLGVLQGVLRAWQLNLKANVLKKLAVSVALIAASMIALSFVPADKLIVAVDAIRMVMLTLIGLLLSMTLIEKAATGLSMLFAGGTVLLLAVGIMVFIKTVKDVIDMMDTISGDESKVRNITLKLIGIVAGMALVVGAITKIYGGINIRGAIGLALGLLAFSIALKKLVESIKLISNLEPRTINNALKNVIPIMVTLGLIGVVIRGIKWTSGLGLMLFISSISLAVLTLNFICSGGIDIRGIESSIAELLTIFTMLIGLAAILRLAGGHKSNTGLNMLLLVGSIYILALSIEEIGKMSTESLSKGLAAITILGLISKVLIGSFGSLSGVNPKAITAIVVMIGIVAASMVALSFMPIDNMLAAATSLFLVFYGISKAITALTSIHEVKPKQMLLWITVIGMLGTAIAALAALSNSVSSWQTLIAAGVSISAVMLAMGATFRLVGKLDGRKMTDRKLKGFTTAMAALLPALVSVGALATWMQYTNVSPSTMIASAISIGIVMAAMGATLRIIGGSKINFKNSKDVLFGMLGLSTSLILVAIAVGTLAWFLQGKDIETTALALGGLAIFLGELAAIAIISGKFGKGSIGGTLEVIGSIILIIAALVAVVTSIGLLAYEIDRHFDGSLEEKLDLAVMVFGKIGEAIGSIYGGFIQGIGTGIANTLPILADGLSGFMENLNREGGFFDVLQNEIDGDKILHNIGCVASALLALSGADLVNFLTDILTGNTDLFGKDSSKRLSERLTGIAKALKSFEQETRDIDSDNLLKITESCSKVAALLKEIPSEGGLLGLIFGHKNLDKFVDGMGKFGSAMVNLQVGTAMLNGDTSKIDLAIEIGEKLVAFNNMLPSEGGFKGAIFGEKSLVSFSEGMVAFGYSICEVDKALIEGNLSKDSVARIELAAKAGSAMTEFANAVPNSGGLIDEVFGQNNIDSFGLKAVAYAHSICNVAKTLSDRSFSQTSVDQIRLIASAGSAMTEFAESISNDGGIIAKIVGDNSVDEFGKKIYNFCMYMGNAIKTYGDSIDYLKAVRIKASGMEFITLANAIDKKTTFKKFGDNIEKVCLNLKNGMEVFADKDFSSFDENADSLRKLISLFKEINDTDFTDLNNFSKTISTLGTDIVTHFADKFRLSSYEIISAVNTMFDYVYVGFNDNIEEIKSSIRDMLYLLLTVVDEEDTENMVFTAMNHFKGYLKNNLGKYTLYDSGRNVVDGFIAGIKSKYEEIREASQYLGNAVKGSVEGNLDIHSPSRVMARLGEFAVYGFVNGIRNVSSAAYLAAEEMADGTVDTLSNSIDHICDIVSSDMYLDPVITPTVDLSNVVDSADKVNSVFNSAKINKQNAADARDKGMRDAFNEMFGAYSNDIVSTLNLNADKGHVTELYIDGNKVASTISGHMDRQLNVMSRRGGRM